MSTSKDFAYYNYNQGVSQNDFSDRSLYHQSFSPQSYYVPVSSINQSYHVNYNSTPLSSSYIYPSTTTVCTPSYSSCYDYNSYNSYNSFNSSGYYSDSSSFQQSPAMNSSEYYSSNQVYPVINSTSHKHNANNHSSQCADNDLGKGPLRESKPGRNLLREIGKCLFFYLLLF